MAAAPREWTLADVRKLPPTVDMRTAAEILGVSYSLAHRQYQQGEWPTRVLKLGNRLRVPTQELRRLLGVEDGAQAS